MTLIRHVRSAARSSFIPADRRVSSLPAALRPALACRWQVAADGNLSCVWEHAVVLPRRRALALVSKDGRSC